MLSVCLMTQDYQMFFTYKQFLHSYFTFNSSITFLFSSTFLPISFCHHHFSTSISLPLSLPLVCPFIHLIGCLTCKQNNANKIRERELLMLQSRNRKESHTQTLTHTQRIWTRAESAGVSKNDECWLDLHISIGFGSWNDIGTAMFIAFRPSSSIVSRVHVCMVLALTCSSAT